MLASSLMALSSKQSQHNELCDAVYSMQLSHLTGFAWSHASFRFVIDTTSFFVQTLLLYHGKTSYARSPKSDYEL